MLVVVECDAVAHGFVVVQQDGVFEAVGEGAEHFVGFCYFFESLAHDIGVHLGVGVGVVKAGEFFVATLDLERGGCAVHSENLVVVLYFWGGPVICCVAAHLCSFLGSLAFVCGICSTRVSFFGGHCLIAFAIYNYNVKGRSVVITIRPGAAFSRAWQEGRLNCFGEPQLHTCLQLNVSIRRKLGIADNGHHREFGVYHAIEERPNLS